MEKYVVESESRRSNWGLVAGVVVALAFLAASVILILSGYPWPGTVIGGVDIVSLATVFVYGSESRRKEREQRLRTLTGSQ